jgi:DNA invertase Pin-like site-specific DNA recombinase
VTTFAYVRTSTEEQLYGIDAQKSAILTRYPEATVKTEHASGRDMTARNRPVFHKLLTSLRQGDVLVAARIDRVSRSTLDFANLLVRAKDEGWDLVVIGLVDMTTPEGKFVAHVMSAAAQLERELISKRTREAMAAATANGKHMGRSGPAIDARLLAEIRSIRNGSRVPFGDVAAELNARQRPHPAAGPWTWQRVRSIMVQHGLHVPEPR